MEMEEEMCDFHQLLAMAPANLTITEKLEYAFVELQSCQTGETSAGVQGHSTTVTIATIVSYVLCALAVLTNIGSLISISGIQKKLNANLLLIYNLSVADILVAVCITLKISGCILPLTCSHLVLHSIRMSAHCLTLLNLIALALDHYYAIVKTLHYRSVMRTSRINWGIAFMWILSALMGFSKFYLPSDLGNYNSEQEDDPELSTTATPDTACGRSQCSQTTLSNSMYAYIRSPCDWVYTKVYDPEHLVYGLTILATFILIFLYSSIFLTLHKRNSLLMHRMKILKRKRKGVITTILIVGTFMICWLPHCLSEVIVLILMHKDPAFVFNYGKMYMRYNIFLYDVIIVNSICDPIIYAFRMREVQRSYKRLYCALCQCGVARRRQQSVSRLGSLNPSSNTSTRTWDVFRLFHNSKGTQNQSMTESTLGNSPGLQPVVCSNKQRNTMRSISCPEKSHNDLGHTENINSSCILNAKGGPSSENSETNSDDTYDELEAMTNDLLTTPPSKHVTTSIQPQLNRISEVQKKHHKKRYFIQSPTSEHVQLKRVTKHGSVSCK